MRKIKSALNPDNPKKKQGVDQDNFVSHATVSGKCKAEWAIKVDKMIKYQKI